MARKTVFMVLSLMLVGVTAILYSQSGKLSHVCLSPESSLYRLDMTKINIEIVTPFPEFPNSIMVYKVNLPNMNEEDVKAFAQKHFELNVGEVSKYKAGNFVLDDGISCLDIDPKVGYYFYFKKHRDTESRDRSDYPDDEKCKEIAWSFLAQHNILPAQDEIKFSRVADNTSDYSMSIGYVRVLDGLKVDGPGERLCVDIARNGTVFLIYKSWNTFEPLKSYPIKNPEEAFKELKLGKGRVYQNYVVTPDEMDYSKVHSGKLVDTKLVYYSLPGEQEYIQPFYCFYIDVEGGQLQGYVEALKEECFKDESILNRIKL